MARAKPAGSSAIRQRIRKRRGERGDTETKTTPTKRKEACSQGQGEGEGASQEGRSAKEGTRQGKGRCEKDGNPEEGASQSEGQEGRRQGSTNRWQADAYRNAPVTGVESRRHGTGGSRRQVELGFLARPGAAPCQHICRADDEVWQEGVEGTESICSQLTGMGSEG